jgi:hypothetical protein
VGVLIPRLSDIVLATIYEGIEEAAAEHGLSTFVTNTRDVPEVQRARTEMVLGRPGRRPHLRRCLHHAPSAAHRPAAEP